MLQIKPHQCEDLNHLTGKAKPRQTLVRNRACLGEMSPRQRQHSLGCCLWFCPSHNHPEFQCFSSNPCCSTLSPTVKVSLFALLLLTTSISEPPCLQKQASNHESSTLRENNLNSFFYYFLTPTTVIYLRRDLGVSLRAFGYCSVWGEQSQSHSCTTSSPGSPVISARAGTRDLAMPRGNFSS